MTDPLFPEPKPGPARRLLARAFRKAGRLLDPTTVAATPLQPAAPVDPIVSEPVTAAPSPPEQSASDARVQILSHPWPYKAAIAFSNDAEMMDWSAFVTVNTLFNGPGGLGIPLSNSLFLFPVRHQFDHTFGYFEGTSEDRSIHAPHIRDLIGTGQIDTIHAYGDFDLGGFDRSLAERALAELDRYNLRIPIFTNHGSDQNFQNIGYDGFGAYQRGDDPAASNYYHLDLSRALGVRYFWVDNALIPQFGGPLLVRRPARDGSELMVFNRYRGLAGYPAPNAGSLERQFTTADLDSLEERGDAVVVYQHFGVARKNEDGTFTKAEGKIFSPEGLALLTSVSDRARDKRLWATTAPQLLDYARLKDAVRASLVGDALVLDFGDEPFDPTSAPPLSFKVSSPSLSRVLVQQAPDRRIAVAARIDREDDDTFRVVLHAKAPAQFEIEA